MTGFASPRFAVRLCFGAALATAAPALAQPASSAAASAALSEALRTLSRSPNSVEALLAAGQASLRLDDNDAALGFFRRAATLSPRDGRAKAGLGAVMVHQRQPLEGLRLFAEAEQAGALSPPYVAERGLAYDLIGDNMRAQRDYATALATGANPTILRRLALSQAIAGDQRAAEATLLPLLQHQDLAAYRTRAFTLAIGGKGDEAVSIAETMLPATLSNRMAPYLRYMPRLTRAQQAAAANLGAFPRAGDIGRDDPQIAAYAATLGVTPVAAAPQSADARLVPSGAPLGAAAAARSRPTVLAATPTPPPVRAVPVAAAPAPAQPAPTPAPAPALAVANPAPRSGASSASDALPERARAMLLQHPELARSGPLGSAQPVAAAPKPVAPPVVAASVPTAAPPVVATNVPPAAQTLVARSAPPEPAPAAPAPALAPPPRVETPPPAPVAVPPSTASPDEVPAQAPQQPVVVATLADSAPPPTAAASGPTPPPPAPAPAAPVGRPSLSEAFGDLRSAPEAPAAAPGTGAVDITKIQPRRPAPPPKPAPPKPPPVRSREWVQVATGRSTSALAFDWRRLKKEAEGALDKETPSTAEWGRTNRLVIGPFASTAAADKMVARLRDKNIDAFRFTSDEGEDVAPLE